jgi:hypothetical protein
VSGGGAEGILKSFSLASISGQTKREMADQQPHWRTTYTDIHKLIGETAKRLAEFKPTLFVAIGHSEFHPSFEAMR